MPNRDQRIDLAEDRGNEQNEIKIKSLAVGFAIALSDLWR